MATTQKFSGVIALVGAAFLFAVASIIVQLFSLSFSYSGVFVAHVRFFTAFVLSAVLVLMGLAKTSIEDTHSWVMRGIFGSIAMILYLDAITKIGSAHAALLNNVSPIFVTIFAVTFFGESLTLRALSGVLIAFGGVYIALGGFDHQNPIHFIGFAEGLLSAVCTGISINYVRKLRREDPMVVYLSSVLIGLVLSSGEIPTYFTVPLDGLLLLILAGVLFFAGQYVMGWGYRHLSAVSGSVLSYTHVVFNALLVSFFFHETISSSFWVGAVLIFAGILLVQTAHIPLPRVAFPHIPPFQKHTP